MDSTTHFIGVTGQSLSRLAAQIEQAANLLNVRGGRRLRRSIAKEIHLALCALRAASNSTVPGFGEGAHGGDFLTREIGRMGALASRRQLEPAGQRVPAFNSRRSHLRVVGGTDIEGAAT